MHPRSGVPAWKLFSAWQSHLYEEHILLIAMYNAGQGGKLDLKARYSLFDIALLPKNPQPSAQTQVTLSN